MRNLFIVAAKIIGLLQFCAAFKYFIVFDKQRLGYWRDALGVLIENSSALFVFALAYVLVVKTEWLADKVGLREKENSELPVPSRGDLLAVGLKLIGVYMGVLFITYVGSLFGLLGMRSTFGGEMYGGIAIIGTFLFVILALLVMSVLFIFKTNAMVVLFTLVENTAWRKIIIAMLVVFLVLAAMMAVFFKTQPSRGNFPFMCDPDTDVIGGSDGPTRVWAVDFP